MVCRNCAKNHRGRCNKPPHRCALCGRQWHLESFCNGQSGPAQGSSYVANAQAGGTVNNFNFGSLDPTAAFAFGQGLAQGNGGGNGVMAAARPGMIATARPAGIQKNAPAGLLTAAGANEEPSKPGKQARNSKKRKAQKKKQQQKAEDAREARIQAEVNRQLQAEDEGEGEDAGDGDDRSNMSIDLDIADELRVRVPEGQHQLSGQAALDAAGISGSDLSDLRFDAEGGLSDMQGRTSDMHQWPQSWDFLADGADSPSEKFFDTSSEEDES